MKFNLQKVKRYSSYKNLQRYGVYSENSEIDALE